MTQFADITPRFDRRFSIVVIDLPMFYADVRTTRLDGKTVKRQGASTNYQVVSPEEMAGWGSTVTNLFADTALVFWWGTWPKIQEYLYVSEAWNCSHSTLMFEWIKVYPRKFERLQQLCMQGHLPRGQGAAFHAMLNEILFKGGGHHSQANSEYMWISVYHRPGAKAHSLASQGLRHMKGRKAQQVHLLPHVRENGKIVHSAKPEEFQNMVEWMYEETEGSFLELFARRNRSLVDNPLISSRRDWFCTGYDLGHPHVCDVAVEICEQNGWAMEGEAPWKQLRLLSTE